MAWFEIMGRDGGYIVVPRGRLRGRALLLRPAQDPSAPHPGPTLAFELLDRRRLGRLDVTARYAPARDRGMVRGRCRVVDADGLDDVLIAAPGNPGYEESSQPGAAYVIYGRSSGGTVRIRHLGRRGLRIAGGAPGGLRSVAGAGGVNRDGRDDLVLGDSAPRSGRGFALTGGDRAAETGYAVAGGGDVNGDGRDDVIVLGPQGNRTPFNTAGGGAFVVFGSRNPRSLDLRGLGRRGFEIRGAGSDWAGFAAAAAGRLNADRRDDVVMTAGGSLALVFRRRSRAPLRLDRLEPDAGFTIDGHVEPNQWYTDDGSGGFITAGAVGADANGDGTADVLAGVRVADHNDRPDSGSAYLFFVPPPG